MTYDVFMSGFGGQGVLLAGNLLAFAAIQAGKEACFFPTYGVEKRGGAANCSVIIADDEVGSPVVGQPSALLALNQLAAKKYYSQVKPGGFCLLNSSLVAEPPEQREDIETLALPATALALEIGDVRLVNMLMLGAYAARSGAIGIADLEQALSGTLPERNHRFIPLNCRALRAGAEQVAGNCQLAG